VKDSWAISGVDLHLAVSGPGVRAALEAALRDAVRSGRLEPGTRLPSSRALAHDLGIARNTVADAYSQLVAEGWLVARQGSGTRVGARAAAVAAATRPAAETGRAAEAGRSAAETGRPAAETERPATETGRSATRELSDRATATPLWFGPAGTLPPGTGPAALRPSAPESSLPAPRFNLRPGVPDLAAFPRAAWLSAARRALSRAPYDAFGYGDPRGQPVLREALAAYLARARGVSASAERIVVVSGFAQGIALLCDVFRARGLRTIGLEAYTLPGHRAAARGMDVVPLPIDEGGAVLRDADALVLTPGHQFPLGLPLAPERRTQAVASGALIVEDDYDGEFRYDRQPVGAMQALAPEQVIYAGTASKTLAPGVRLAWLVLPSHLVDEVAAAKALADRNSSAIDQLTFAELIASGAYDRHVRRARLAYRRRRDRLVAALPRARIAGISAGLHALVELDEPEHDVVARAANHGLAVEGLDSYRVPGAGDAGVARHGPALVVGYATPPEHAFTSALARLSAVLASTSAPPSS
jgi:GntR family transcriptional regulator / MocR family aminotransferase